MQATWPSACQPQPMTPSVVAPGFARCFAATPLAAPVRSWPILSASMTAASFAFSVSKSTTTNGVPPGSAVYDLSPARPSSSSAADITANAPSSSRIRVRGLFWTAPRAMRSKEASIASSASAGASSFPISASVR
jgi:hypothetical protein